MTVAGRRETWWQFVRYGVNGGLVTALYALVYAVLVHGLGLHPQYANLAGYLVAVSAGYALHSRVTFRDHGERDHGTRLRFVAASIASYAINAFWTWLCASWFGWPPLTPLIPIATITPALLFVLNRTWVFR